MEAELINAELVLPTHFSFKRIQIYEKYLKGQPTVSSSFKNNLRQFLASLFFSSFNLKSGCDFLGPQMEKFERKM